MSDPLDEVRVVDDPTNPDVVLLYLPEFMYLDTQAWAVELGIPRGLLAPLRAALDGAHVPTDAAQTALGKEG